MPTVEKCGIVNSFVPSLDVVRGTVGVGMADQRVVAVALLGFVQAGKDFCCVIFAIFVAAGLLLGQVIQPAGFQQITHFEPFVYISVIPAVTY